MLVLLGIYPPQYVTFVSHTLFLETRSQYSRSAMCPVWSQTVNSSQRRAMDLNSANFRQEGDPAQKHFPHRLFPSARLSFSSTFGTCAQVTRFASGMTTGRLI